MGGHRWSQVSGGVWTGFKRGLEQGRGKIVGSSIQLSVLGSGQQLLLSRVIETLLKDSS